MSKEFQEGFVTANGIRQHYYRSTPPGGGPAVILLHGVTDNGMCWIQVARQLRDTYDLIMLDARGHGLSDAPEGSYGQRIRAEDVAGAIDALGLERPVLYGHSMGAETSATAAAFFPQKVSAVLLEDPPWRAPVVQETNHEQSADWQQQAEQRRKALMANREMSEQALIERVHAEHPTWHEAELRPWAESKRQVSIKIVSVWNEERVPWSELLQKIECPILLITSDPDKGAIVTPETAREAQNIWRSGRVAHIPGAGHNIHRERFDAVMEQVKSFLAEVTGK